MVTDNEREFSRVLDLAGLKTGKAHLHMRLPVWLTLPKNWPQPGRKGPSF